MTFALTPEEEKRAARPELAGPQGPIRHTGGLFRSATPGGATPLGVPQASAEESVIAAVRMAYRVADAQVQRSARLAARLSRASGAPAKEGGERTGEDAIERLIVRGVTDAVARFEALAAEPEASLKRLIAVQRQLLAALLGVAAPAAPAAPAETEPKPAAAPPKVRIFLKGEERRAVALKCCEIARGPLPEVTLAFHPVESAAAGRLEGLFARGEDGEARLTVATLIDAPSGRWRAAVCRDDGEQVGVIEIEL